LPGFTQRARKDCFAGVPIDQRKLLQVILFGGDDQSLLWGLKVVTDLIDDYMGLAYTRLGAETAQTNGKE